MGGGARPERAARLCPPPAAAGIGRIPGVLAGTGNPPATAGRRRLHHEAEVAAPPEGFGAALDRARGEHRRGLRHLPPPPGWRAPAGILSGRARGAHHGPQGNGPFRPAPCARLQGGVAGQRHPHPVPAHRALSHRADHGLGGAQPRPGGHALPFAHDALRHRGGVGHALRAGTHLPRAGHRLRGHPGPGPEAVPEHSPAHPDGPRLHPRQHAGGGAGHGPCAREHRFRDHRAAFHPRFRGVLQDALALPGSGLQGGHRRRGHRLFRPCHHRRTEARLHQDRHVAHPQHQPRPGAPRADGNTGQLRRKDRLAGHRRRHRNPRGSRHPDGHRRALRAGLLPGAPRLPQAGNPRGHRRVAPRRATAQRGRPGLLHAGGRTGRTRPHRAPHHPGRGSAQAL